MWTNESLNQKTGELTNRKSTILEFKCWLKLIIKTNEFEQTSPQCNFGKNAEHSNRWQRIKNGSAFSLADISTVVETNRPDSGILNISMS